MTRRLTAVLCLLAGFSPAFARASNEVTADPNAGVQAEKRTLPGGAVVRFAPGTRYTLGRPIKVQLGAGPERKLAQSLTLHFGRVDIQLPNTKYPRTAVFVQAPHKLSAVAKGGHSVVIAGETRATVAALSGEMLVATGKNWGALPSGTIREYEQGVSAGEHGPLAAPQASLSAPIALSLGGAPSAIIAAASPVVGASAYEFNLWRSGGKKPELLRRARSEDGRLTFDRIQPGAYEVSARALDHSGLEGAESPRVPLRVVGAEPPEGAKIIEGGIRIPKSQRVRLFGTDGVEVSYGAGSHFTPAPSTVGLYRGELTVVRLRAQGSKRELSLLLAPRVVRADVQLGPARARWPDDEISVSVRLLDAKGRPLEEEVAIQTTVSVNVTPVEVDWKRDGNRFTGVVPRSSEPGPWVVRVEVTDEPGALLSHEFLEVVGAEPAGER